MTASDLELTADERALARRVHEVGRDTLLPIAHAWGERHEMCRDLIRAMADNDLFGLNIPAGYGGRGGDHRYSVLLCLIRETLGHLDPVVDFHFGLQGLGTAAIVRQGNDAQRAEYLPSLVAGEKIFAFVLTEPHSGSDVLGMRTRARRDGDGWVIDGSKTFISGVPDADVHVVLARTGEHHVDVGIRHTRDEGLGAIDDPPVAVAPCTRAHAEHVRAGVRFGQDERKDLLAGDQRWQVLRTLGVVALPHYGRRPEALQAEVEVDDRVEMAERLADQAQQDRVAVVTAPPAVPGRDVEPEQVVVGHRPDEIPTHLVSLAPRMGDGQQGVTTDLVDAPGQRPLVGGELEVRGRHDGERTSSAVA